MSKQKKQTADEATPVSDGIDLIDATDEKRKADEERKAGEEREQNEQRKQMTLRFDAVSIPTSSDVGTGYRSAYMCRACSQEVALDRPLEHVCPTVDNGNDNDNDNNGDGDGNETNVAKGQG